MKVRLHDRLVRVSTRKKTKDGFLEANATLACTGIQDYTIAELGAGVPAHFRDKSVIRLNRPESEVFAKDTLSALSHLPLTIGHPSKDVTPQNVKDLQVGYTLSPVERIGDEAVGPIKVLTEEAIKMVDSGRDQLSVGYDTKVLWLSVDEAETKGYDGTQTNIVPNHIALVDEARGGEHVRISDEGAAVMETRIIDGVSYEFSPQAAQLVDRLIAQKKELEDSHKGEIQKLGDEKTKLQGEFDAKTKELEEEKKTHLSDEKIAKLVDEKAKLIDSAKKFMGDDDTDLSVMADIDIKKTVIAKVWDGMDLKDKDAIYVDAVFDGLVHSKSKDDSVEQVQKLGDGLNDKNNKPKSSADEQSAMSARRGPKKPTA